LGRFVVKKDGVVIVKKPHLLNMFPSFYLLHLQQQLKATEYLTLKILVYLLEGHKQVSLELLASLMPYPIQFESRRRSKHKIFQIGLPPNRTPVVPYRSRNIEGKI
jgi:hypothetical protein